jgi:hypothetical protein
MPSDRASAASAQVIALHDEKLADPDWPEVAGTFANEPALTHWIIENHRNNCRLWAEEDLARRTHASDTEIALNKRAIDRFNQARNDATERVDEMLLIDLGLVDAASARTDAPVSNVPPDAALNSETAGSMIDRLSILSLKIKAMRDQTMRTDVDETHRTVCRGKLAKLQEQRADLGRCLDQLLHETAMGTRYFKVYRQFKMYNDPQLNPQLVKERQKP